MAATSAQAEAELQFDDFSYYGENSPVPTTNYPAGLTPGITTGNYETDSPDETGAESFRPLDSLQDCISTDKANWPAGPSSYLTPVRLQLDSLPPLMHSTPVSTSVYKQLAFQESFEECHSSESSLSMIIPMAHSESELLEPSDTSYCNFTCENVNSTLLKSDLSCTTSLIELSDSTDCNEPSSSLILIEPPTDPNTSPDETVYALPHISKKRRIGNGKARKSLVTHEECCNHCCLSHFTASEVNNTIEYFKSKNTVEQNQFLLDSFKVISNQESTNHITCGKPVCKNAYIRIMEISEKRYNKIQKIFKMNPTIKIQHKPVVRSLSTKVIEAKTWMTRYFSRIGDSMPHMDQIHLPHGLTKQDIYHTMKSQLQEQGLTTVVSLSHYYSIWDSSFKKVVIPKV